MKKKNIEELRARAEAGYDYAQCHMGKLYRFGILVPRDAEEAVKWFLMAAEQGYAEAQFFLSFMYAWGEGMEKEKLKEALEWCRKSAKQGYLDAQKRLGDMYYFGLGTPVDKRGAARWYRKAAEKGHAESQYHLSQMYRSGIGVRTNRRYSKYLLNKSGYF